MGKGSELIIGRDKKEQIFLMDENIARTPVRTEF